MPNGPVAIVQKLWNYCNVLRDDGLSYGDYIEQLTYLLFLKMADERKQLQLEPSAASSPKATTGRACWSWKATTLEIQYRKTLENPGARSRHARHHLPQGAEQDSGPGQAAPADRRPDRPRAVDRRSTWT